MPNKSAGRFEKQGAGAFARIAEDVFAPIYPVIAEQIVRHTGITAGACIDIGAGPGHLGLALAATNPRLQVILYDASADMLNLARKNSFVRKLTHRVSVQTGQAEELPFLDNSVQLAVSRGSIFFWDDQVRGINEIYRVIAPKGCAYIGGGFGNVDLKRKIQQTMAQRNPDWDAKRKARLSAQGERHFESVMERSDVNDYNILRSEAGLWISFSK
jgi:ubiquinone/menaquinone biosynthesis C-methylase UbiE